MFRSLARLGPAGLAISFPFTESPDRVTLSKFDSKIYDEDLAKESGFRRIYNMLKPDEFDNVSPELNSVLQATFTAGVIGAMYGGIIRARTSYLTFLETNEASIFKTPLDAKKKLQDRVTMGFSKGAFQCGWRFAAFTFSYCGLATAISVYRGKTSMYEYMVGGAVTGVLYKANMGVRGIVVGGGLGLILGTVSGAATVFLLRITGKSMEELRYWQNNIQTSRSRAVDRIMEHTATEKPMPLLDEHDRVLAHTAPDSLPDKTGSFLQ